MALFVACTALYTTLAFLAVQMSGHYFVYMYAYMWSPALGALTARALTRDRSPRSSTQWPSLRSLASSAVLPMLYCSSAYLLIWATPFAEFNPAAWLETSRKMGVDRWPLPAAIALFALLRPFFGTLSNMAAAFGEELGWRGYLMPALRRRMSFMTAATVTGLIWGGWHYPLILTGYARDSPVPLAAKIVAFTLMTIGLSILMGTMCEATGSVWPAVVIHASHNYFYVLGDTYTGGTRAEWVASEDGLVLPVTIVVVALVVRRCVHAPSNATKTR